MRFPAASRPRRSRAASCRPSRAAWVPALLLLLPLAAGAAEVRLLDLRAPLPDAWQAEPPSSHMRLAQATVPPDAHFVVYYFGPGQGGTTALNIARWQSQFSGTDGAPVEPAVRRHDVAGMAVTTAELRGDYARGVGTGGDAPRLADHILLAAIVESPRGKLFVHLYGPAGTVAAERAGFEAFVDGMRPAPVSAATPLRSDLYAKYNVAGPRYTSYPTVPYWDEAGFDPAAWRERVAAAFARSNDEEGVSVYVHLPFCERLCTFCGCTKRITKNHGVEAPYVDSLLAEWDLYRALWRDAPRVRELHFGGGTPTFFAPHELARLVRGLLAGASPPADAEYSLEAHPNSTTCAHLETLRELGFRRLSLGVQDFDPVVQKAINRIQPFERVAEVTETARATGYTSLNFDLVYGLPKQTLASVEDTVCRVLELRPERIAYYSYAHVPWIRGLGQRGFSEADLPRDAEKRALYESGRRLLEDAGYVEVGMDHFALPGDALHAALGNGSLHRNFMGYTPVHTQLCVALGMSAIGDTWDAFAQNEKKVEDYQARVAAGALPVFRGHLLDEEDRLIRRHVLELMCRFRTRWQADAPEAPILEAARERLAEMQADGLVQGGEGWLAVTDAGRPFVRNVCMTLDARLWRNRPTTQIFSQTV